MSNDRDLVDIKRPVLISLLVTRHRVMRHLLPPGRYLVSAPFVNDEASNNLPEAGAEREPN